MQRIRKHNVYVNMDSSLSLHIRCQWQINTFELKDVRIFYCIYDMQHATISLSSTNKRYVLCVYFKYLYVTMTQNLGAMCLNAIAVLIVIRIWWASTGRIRPNANHKICIKAYFIYWTINERCANVNASTFTKRCLHDSFSKISLR